MDVAEIANSELFSNKTIQRILDTVSLNGSDT